MSDALSAAVSIGFHGLAFAMVLYLISVGLSVTMGLMGFVNLAHGVFAMVGGYVLTSLMSRFGVPLPPALRWRRPRSGPVDNGARVHVGGGRHLCLGSVATAVAAAAMAERGSRS